MPDETSTIVVSSAGRCPGSFDDPYVIDYSWDEILRCPSPEGDWADHDAVIRFTDLRRAVCIDDELFARLVQLSLLVPNNEKYLIVCFIDSPVFYFQPAGESSYFTFWLV